MTAVAPLASFDAMPGSRSKELMLRSDLVPAPRPDPSRTLRQTPPIRRVGLSTSQLAQMPRAVALASGLCSVNLWALVYLALVAGRAERHLPAGVLAGRLASGAALHRSRTTAALG